MDTGLSLASPMMGAPPAPQPDLRPAADAAAIIRDTTPFIPLPLPASTGQAGAVVKSKLPVEISREAIAATERVLKPFGIEMLPGLTTSANLPQGIPD